MKSDHFQDMRSLREYYEIKQVEIQTRLDAHKVCSTLMRCLSEVVGAGTVVTMSAILLEAEELLNQDAKAWRTLKENPEAFLDEVADSLHETIKLTFEALKESPRYDEFTELGAEIK